MFKKFNFKPLSYLLIGLLIGCLFPIQSIFADQPIKLIINGQQIKCDVPPQNINGRVLVPARFVAENLGAEVDWDGINRVVVISNKKKENINKNINTSNASNIKSNPLKIGETYDNGKIKITVYDFKQKTKHPHLGTIDSQYKIKFEPYPDYSLNNKKCDFICITDNDKYNCPEPMVTNNIFFGMCDFGEKVESTMRNPYTEKYKIESIIVNLESLGIKNIIWEINN